MKSKRYEKEFFSQIVKHSHNLTDIAEKLNLKPHCGNRDTIKKYINIYRLDTSHFRVRYELRIKRKIPLSEIMISGSTYSTTNLKERLYDEGLKERECEKCGQGEIWYGDNMSLILDHINGDSSDHRFENLRILCPNCNATLPTHGGKNKRNKKYYYYNDSNQYCNCGNKKNNKAELCKKCNDINIRKVKRPTYNQLIKEIKETSYCAVGRKYNVSDNTIRKWIKFYENNNTPS